MRDSHRLHSAVKPLPQEPPPAGELVNYHGPAVRTTRKLTEAIARELL